MADPQVTDLFTVAALAGPRCEKPPMPHLRRLEPASGDSEYVRLRLWNQLVMDTYFIGCLSGGKDCPRCRATFLTTFNRPAGPWAETPVITEPVPDARE